MARPAPVSGSRPTEHRNDGRAVPYPDLADGLEAMPLIERPVPGVCRFEISGQPFGVAPGNGRLQQRGPKSPALPWRLNAYERQIPVGLIGMVADHLLDDCSHGRPLRGRDAFLDQTLHRVLVGSSIG